MRHTGTIIITSFLLTTAAAIGLAPAQGGLVPETAPGATMKTLGQIEPRTPIEALPFEITTRGSYFLARDLVLSEESNGSHGIVISASEVTLDLGGFTLTGGSGNGIYLNAPDGQRNVTIRNGILRDWGQSGIDADDDAEVPLDTEDEGAGTTTVPAVFARTGVVVENVTVADCGALGLALGGQATVRGCLVYNVPLGGIRVSAGSRIANCRVYNIGAAGFQGEGGVVLTGCQGSNCSLRDGAPDGEIAPGFLLTDALLQDCLASNNGHAGFALTNSSATNCRAFNNQTEGFLLAGGTLTGCSATNNTLAGFAGAGAGNAAHADLLNCSARNNNRGFVLRGGTLQNCTAAFNNAEGFALSALQVTACAAAENDGDGFVIDQVRLTGSQATANARNGILAASDNQITGCHVTDNGGAENGLAGIRVTGNRNRVTDNSLSRSVFNTDFGIQVLTDTPDPATQNVVTQNSAWGFGVAFDVQGTGNVFGGVTASPGANPSPLVNLGADETPQP